PRTAAPCTPLWSAAKWWLKTAGPWMWTSRPSREGPRPRGSGSPPPTPATGPCSNALRASSTPSALAWPRPPTTSTASRAAATPTEPGKQGRRCSQPHLAPGADLPRLEGEFTQRIGTSPAHARIDLRTDGAGGRLRALETAVLGSFWGVARTLAPP